MRPATIWSWATLDRRRRSLCHRPDEGRGQDGEISLHRDPLWDMEPSLAPSTRENVKEQKIWRVSYLTWRLAARFRRLPGGREAPGELVREAVDRDALLPQGVAIADRDRAVLERLVVDGHAERRADLVLAAVALADRAALVVLALHASAQLRVHL